MKLLAGIVVFVEFVIVAGIIIPAMNLRNQPVILQMIVMIPSILAMRWTWRWLSNKQLKPKKGSRGRYASVARRSMASYHSEPPHARGIACGTTTIKDTKGRNMKDWFGKNKAIIIVLIVSIAAIIIAALLRPPRYQKGGPNNNWILDTKTGKWITPYSR